MVPHSAPTPICWIHCSSTVATGSHSNTTPVHLVTHNLPHAEENFGRPLGEHHAARLVLGLVFNDLGLDLGQ